MRRTLQSPREMVLKLADGLTFYFSRHGQTLANVEGRFQGKTVDTPLTSVGVEQARAIGQILKSNVKDVAALPKVASPFPRACRTMEIVLTTLGLPAAAFTKDARLSEIDLGDWDGLTKAEARALDPAAFDEREADKWNVRVPGGRETYKDVAERAASFVGELSNDTFAVSHGAFTRILRGLFAGLNAHQMSALDEPQGCVFMVQGSDCLRLDL